jgi:hypothetical protein
VLKKLAAGIMATAIVGMVVPAAAQNPLGRSTVVYLCNLTPFTLNLTEHYLIRGKWRIVPPDKIGPGQGCAYWYSRSDGFATGTRGSASYCFEGEYCLSVEWNNPYVGNNSYADSFPDGFKITREGGAGDQAEVTFTLSEE